MSRSWERACAAIGLLGVVLWVGAVGVVSSVPQTDAAASKILPYYAAHHTPQVVAMLAFLAGALCVIVFLSALRDRLSSAGRNQGPLAGLAFPVALLSVAFWVLALSLFTLPAFAANDYHLSELDPNTVRLTGELGYLCTVLAGTISALAVWAASADTLRMRTLPAWFGWLGAPIGMLLLASVVFIPAFLFWLWIALAAILILMRPAAERPTP
jgi:hypothetical protein